MDKNWKYPVILVCGLLICFSLVSMAKIVASAAISIKQKGSVQVKGFATQQITSNLGIFEARIQASNADLKLAYDQLAADKSKVGAFLKKNNVEEALVGWGPVNIEEKYVVNESGHTLNQVYEYIVTQSFKFQTSNVAQVQTLSAAISELLKDGVRLTTFAPVYLYTDLENLKIEMIGNATENAKKRARIISEKGRFRLGNISQVRVGVFQITPLNSNDVSDYGVNDSTTIQKEIKCVVDIDYFVK